jgi:UDP-glucose 4-epimerase
VSGSVLVTGGAGFIGSHLVDALVADGETVVVLDDFSTGEEDNLASALATGRVRVVRGSILDPAVVALALKACDRVYHMAVQCVRRSLGNPWQSHQVNAEGSLIVLEQARKRDVSRFVYCSSSEVYGNSSQGFLDEDTTPCRPATVYGAAKLTGELYAEAYRETYGLRTVVVRPFNAYGPRAHAQGDLAEVIPRFVIRVLNGKAPVIFGDGTNGRDFTYVVEVARGVMLAGRSDACIGRRINIAYGRMITVREVADAVMRICGRNDLSAAFSRPRPGDVRVLQANTSRAADLLDYRAEIDFDAGLQLYLDWFKARYADPSQLLEDTIENWSMPDSDTGSAA